MIRFIVYPLSSLIISTRSQIQDVYSHWSTNLSVKQRIMRDVFPTGWQLRSMTRTLIVFSYIRLIIIIMIKREAKKKKKQSPQTVDYFPRGNIFLNERSTQIEHKTLGADFIFNEAPLSIIHDKKEKKRQQKLAKLDLDAEIDQARSTIQAPLNVPLQHQDSKEIAPTQQIVAKSLVAKIPHIKFEKGNQVMMAVCELNKYYMVTNHTRNQKGYINASEVNGDLLLDYKLGELIFATVMEKEGMRIKKQNETIDVSHKLQLTMNPSTINFGLSAAKIVPGLVLSGIVASIDQSGATVELGLSDDTKAFIRQGGLNLKEGSGVQIVAVKVKQKAKIVVATELRSQKGREMILNPELDGITFQVLKTGCLVKCTFKQKYQNGIQVSFLGHFSGFIFVDHLRKLPKDYRKKDQFFARIIAIKQSSKLVALSELPHIVKLTNASDFPVVPGDCFKMVGVSKLIYGSYEVKLEKDNKQCTALLHKSHVSDELQKNISIGYFLPEVQVQEINYFDNKPIIRLKSQTTSILSQGIINYQSLKCGEILSVQITDIKNTGIGVRVNSFIRGFIPLHQIANIPLHQVPSRFTKNKMIKAAVFVVSPADKYVELTLKPKFLKQAKEMKIKSSKQNYEVNEEVTGMVVNSRINVGIFMQFWGDVFGILHDEELLAQGRDQSSFKKGELLDVFVKRNEATRRMLTLSFEPNKLVKGPKTNPLYSPHETILKEINNLNKKSKKQQSSEFITGQFITCEVVLPQSEILNRSPYLKNQYAESDNELKQSPFFLTKCENGSYGLLPVPLLSTFFPHFLSSKLASSKIAKSEPFLAIVIKLLDSVPILGAATLLKQLGENEVIKGSEVYGFVQRFNTDYGVTFNLLKGGTGLAKKQNLSYFSENIYEIGRFFRLKVTDIPDPKKSYVKNNFMASLEQTEKEVLVNCFKREIQFLNSLVPHSVQLGGLQKVKKLNQNGARMEVKSKSQEIMMIEISNYEKYDKSTRFWIRVLDWTQDVLIAQFVSSDKYKALLSSDVTMEEARVLMDNAEFTMIQQNHSKRPTYVLKKQPLVATELPQLTNIYPVDLMYLSSNLALPKQYTRLRGASEQFVNSPAEIEFIMTGVKPTSLLGKTTQGTTEVFVKISKAQTSKDLQQKWNHLEPGLKLRARVLGQNNSNPKFKYLELTMLPSSHPNTKPLDLINEGQKQILAAVVQEVKPANSSPLVLQTSLSSRGRVSFHHIPLSYLPKLNQQLIDLKSLFPLGRVLQVKKLQTPKSEEKAWHHYFSLLGAIPKLTQGSKRIIRIIKNIQGKGVIAQLDQQNYGFIDITEIADQFIADPIGLLMESRSSGGYWVARILGEDSTHHQKWKLSTRSSLINDKLYKLISPQSSSELFVKTFNKTRGDLRNYFLKYGGTDVQLLGRGTLLVGYVSNCNQNGCFIRISTELTVRAAAHELQHSTAYYQPGRCVVCRVLSVTKDKRVHVSLKEHFVKTGINLTQNDLKRGKIVECSVIAASHRKIFVQIKGSSFKGKIKLKSDNLSDPSQTLVCKIVKCDKTQHPPKFKLDILQSSQYQEKQIINKAESTNLEESEIYQVINKMYDQEPEIKTHRMEIADEGELSGEEDEQDHMISQLQELNELEENDQEQQQAEEEDQMEQEEENQSEEDVKIIQEQAPDEVDSAADNDSVSSASQEQDETSEEEQDHQKRQSKSLNQRLQEEKKVRAAQNELMNTDMSQPTTVAGYEKALLKDNQKAIVWIQYAAFVLEHQQGLNMARKIFERGLRKIDPVQQTEKLNLWLAYLNLQYSYGKDRDQFNSILRKALQVNDNLKVYSQLLKMYRLSKDHKELLHLFPQLVKKYKSHYPFWEKYLEWAYDIKRTLYIAKVGPEADQDLEELEDQKFPDLKKQIQEKAIEEAQEIKKLERIPKPEDILSRGLQSLKKADHIKFITKSARLEYQCGQPEQGRTLFEGIVTNYPKRSDVWSVYFDCEIKYSLPKAVRALFERCITLEDLPLNKIKFFYKRYMDYESKYGTQKRVEKIKEKAVAFVKRLPGNEEEEDEEKQRREEEQEKDQTFSEEEDTE